MIGVFFFNSGNGLFRKEVADQLIRQLIRFGLVTLVVCLLVYFDEIFLGAVQFRSRESEFAGAFVLLNQGCDGRLNPGFADQSKRVESFITTDKSTHVASSENKRWVGHLRQFL